MNLFAHSAVASGNVGLERRRLRETLLATLTFERALAGVRPEVPGETGCLVEALVADLTEVALLQTGKRLGQALKLLILAGQTFPTHFPTLKTKL